MKMRECHTWRQTKPQQKKKRVFAQSRKARFFVQAALALGILFGVVLSAVFVTGAGESRNQLVSADDAMQRFDASGQDSVLDAAIIDPRLILGTELPVIYGVDIEEVYQHERVEADAPSESESDIYFDVLPDDIKLEIVAGWPADTDLPHTHTGGLSPDNRSRIRGNRLMAHRAGRQISGGGGGCAQKRARGLRLHRAARQNKQRTATSEHIVYALA